MSKVCRTCLAVLSDDDNCFSLDSRYDNSCPSFRNKLSICVPELALDVFEHAVICSFCIQALDTSYSFKSQCLQTEQKILDFTRYTGCSTNSINVSDLAQFTETNLRLKEESQMDVKPSISCNTQNSESEMPMMDVKPVGFCKPQNLSKDMTPIKIEPIINNSNEVEIHSKVSAPPDVQMVDNELGYNIPFNPELDVEVRSYCLDMLNNYPTPNKPDASDINVKGNWYNCIYCQKEFELLTQLDAHMAQHAMERPFRCETCERGFVRKDKLMLHNRIHTGEKPFKCMECGRCFSRKDKLNNHIRTHTGEKPHQCILCQKSFARKDKLNLHMKSQHWLALANLEITVVKYENGNKVPQTTLTENLPKTN